MCAFSPSPVPLLGGSSPWRSLWSGGGGQLRIGVQHAASCVCKAGTSTFELAWRPARVPVISVGWPNASCPKNGQPTDIVVGGGTVGMGKSHDAPSKKASKVKNQRICPPIGAIDSTPLLSLPLENAWAPSLSSCRGASYQREPEPLHRWQPECWLAF